MEATITDLDQTPRRGKAACISRAGDPLVQRTSKWDKHEEHEQSEREFQRQTEIAHSPLRRTKFGLKASPDHLVIQSTRFDGARVNGRGKHWHAREVPPATNSRPWI
jgi:hypothetical protein